MPPLSGTERRMFVTYDALRTAAVEFDGLGAAPGALRNSKAHFDCTCSATNARPTIGLQFAPENYL